MQVKYASMQSSGYIRRENISDVMYASLKYGIIIINGVQDSQRGSQGGTHPALQRPLVTRSC